MAIFMKFGKVEGNVTTAGFEKWIELNSLQWGVGRGFGSAVSGAKREGSAPSISEITVTKVMEKSSNGLLKDAVAGTMDVEAKIAFTTTSKDVVTQYLQYTLTDTAVSGYSISSGGDRPSESLSLNFTKIEIKYIDMDSKVQGQPDTITYDLGLQKLS